MSTVQTNNTVLQWTEDYARQREDWLSKRSAANVVVNSLQPAIERLKREAQFAENSLSEIAQQRYEATKPVNQAAKAFNRQRLWLYLLHRINDGQTWCSWRESFFPNEEGGPFFALHYRQGARIDEDDFRMSWGLYVTPSLEIMSTKLFCDAHHEGVLPVLLRSDGSGNIDQFYTEPNTSVEDTERLWKEAMYGDSRVLLSCATLHLPTEIPDELAEKYGLGQALEPIKY